MHVLELWICWPFWGIKETCEIPRHLKFTEKLVLPGLENGVRTDTVFHFFVLQAILFIYQCKTKTSIPYIARFLRQLIFRFKTEFYARMNFERSKLRQDWFCYRAIIIYYIYIYIIILIIRIDVYLTETPTDKACLFGHFLLLCFCFLVVCLVSKINKHKVCVFKVDGVATINKRFWSRISCMRARVRLSCELCTQSATMRFKDWPCVWCVAVCVWCVCGVCLTLCVWQCVCDSVSVCVIVCVCDIVCMTVCVCEWHCVYDSVCVWVTLCVVCVCVCDGVCAWQCACVYNSGVGVCVCVYTYSTVIFSSCYLSTWSRYLYNAKETVRRGGRKEEAEIQKKERKKERKMGSFTYLFIQGWNENTRNISWQTTNSQVNKQRNSNRQWNKQHTQKGNARKDNTKYR